MKFLCPQCSAKYKIGDDKLAGRRLVRMKCRKCDSTLEIRPHESGALGRLEVAVAGGAAPKVASPVIRSMPISPAESFGGRTSQRPTAPAPAAVPSSAVPSAVAKSSGLSQQTLGLLTDDLGLRELSRRTQRSGNNADGSEDSAGQEPLRAAVPRPGAARSPALRGLRIGRPPQRGLKPGNLNQTLSGVAPPTPGAHSEGQPPRAQAAGRGGALGVSAKLDNAPGNADPSANGMAAAALARPAVVEVEEEADSTEILNEEFSQVLTSGEAANDPELDSEPRASEEPIAQALSKAPNAVADGVEEPESEDLPTTPPPAAEQWFVGVGDEPKGPLTRDQVKELVGSGDVTPESLAWKDGMGDWQPASEIEELGVLFHPPEEELSSPPPAGVADAVVPAQADPTLPGLTPTGRRSGIPPLAWLALLVAVAFGATITYVLVPKGQTIVREVPVPQPAAAAETSQPEQAAPVEPQETEAIDAPEEAAEEEAAAKDDPAPAAPTSGKAKAPVPEKSEPAEEKKAPADNAKKGGLLSNLSAPPQPSGPGREHDAEANGPNKQLDGASISRVVRRQTPGVKRACWNQALLTATSNAPSSARVMVSATIASSGSVTNVTTSGDPRGYRGLARCIEGKVRSWRFPAAEGTTTANIPFVFAAQ